jgi:hypothetical protein
MPWVLMRACPWMFFLAVSKLVALGMPFQGK